MSAAGELAVRRAWDDARATLRAGPSLAAPVPSSLDVLALLHRAGVVGTRRDVLESCRALGRPLADQTEET